VDTRLRISSARVGVRAGPHARLEFRLPKPAIREPVFSGKRPHLSGHLLSISPVSGHEIVGIGCTPSRLTRSASTPAQSAISSHLDSHHHGRRTTFCRG